MTPIHTVKEIIHHPQALARNMIAGFDHKGKEIKAPGNPFKMSGLEETFEAPPDLGEHTDQILSGVLHYTREKIEALRKENVIG